MPKQEHDTRRKATRAHHAARIGLDDECPDCKNLLRHAHNGFDDEQVDAGGFIASGVPNDGNMTPEGRKFIESQKSLKKK